MTDSVYPEVTDKKANDVKKTQNKTLLSNAVELMQKKQWCDAKAILVAIAKENPDYAAAQQQLAEIYLAENRLDEALEHIKAAVQQKPDNGFFQYRLGFTLLKMQQYQQAIDSFTLATRLDPALGEPFLLLGTLYQNLGEEEKALQFYLSKADQLKVPEVFEAIARIYHIRHQFDAAYEYYQKALRLRPSLLPAQAGLASLLVKRMMMECRYDAEQANTARTLCISLIQHQHEVALAKRTLADIESTEGKSRAAIIHYREALQLQPEDKSVRGNLAITLLRSGQYREGWSYLRWRQDLSGHDYGFASRDIAGVCVPQWQGEISPATTLLVTSEQGVGDQVLHVQHLLPLCQAGMNIVLTCNTKLVPLLRRSLTQITVLPDSEPIPAALAQSIDAQTFLLDVPYFMKLNPFEYQAPHAYLKAAEPDNPYAATLHSPTKVVRVGIAWNSASGSSGPGKSVKLEKLMPLLTTPGCQFISVQYGDAVQQALVLNKTHPDLITVETSFNPFDDLDKAATQLSTLDLLISVSNAAVHLAGALGVPTWVLTQHVPLWHWFEKREDSPWYPSVRLFRQTQINHWDDVIEKVAAALKNHIENDIKKSTIKNADKASEISDPADSK